MKVRIMAGRPVSGAVRAQRLPCPTVRARLFGIALAALGCALLLAPVDAHSISRSRLSHGLSNQMQRAGGASGAWVMDMDARRNRILFSWASQTRRVLASNTKLFTTAAALDRFGAKRRLTTRLYARRPNGQRGHTLKGGLVIVGAGDPALASTGFARANDLPLTRIANLARDVRRAGIRRVTGAVRADDTVFDRHRRVPTSGVDGSGELAPLSGLSYNSGFAGGHYAKNPELVAARKLKRRLRNLGVRVKGRTGHANLPRSTLRRRPLGKVRSPRLAALISETNKPSNNFFAEMLLKRLAARPGVKGTTRRGARRAQRFARKLGGRVRMENGSGLSRANRASPQRLGRFLVAMNRHPRRRSFRHSLPVAGREGTVSERMHGTAAEGRCRAKTGTLIGVSTLSGYCRAGHGLVAFSILMNSVDITTAHRAQDKMAALIARYRR
jgi:D-alanyl-D-alanine carboxypeptidase/D-alanyl-D-alanine-endopeptidase (penicillin-binding protein 4)